MIEDAMPMLRRIVGWRSLLSLVTLVLPLVLTATQASAQTGSTPVSEPGTIVGTAGVNVRACPNDDCAVHGVARLGESVIVTGDEVDGYLPVDWGGVSGYVYGLYVATADEGTPELVRGEAGCNRVALIFDIGIGYETHLDVLEWMKANDVPATVFAMGWWADENPDLLEQIAAMGFPIGSHGDQRIDLTDRSDDEIRQDISDAADAIERATGSKPEPYMTPYAAAIDERVRGLIARAGYLPVGWEVPADDWDFGITADDVFEKVVPNVTDGDIVELHLDGPATADSTAIAIPWIVERLRLKGYQFVTIPDMAQPCD